MTKLEKLQKKVDESQKNKARLEAEINDLREKQSELDAKAEKMAEAGDVDGYLRVKGQADRAGAELHVKELQLKKADLPVEKEEALAAWNEFIKSADAAFEKKFEAYKKARQELGAMLKDIVRERENAKQMRDLLVSYCGVNKGSMTPLEYETVISTFAMKPLTPKEAQNDCNFFRKFGIITQEEATNIQRLLFSFIS